MIVPGSIVRDLDTTGLTCTWIYALPHRMGGITVRLCGPMLGLIICSHDRERALIAGKQVGYVSEAQDVRDCSWNWHERA